MLSLPTIIITTLLLLTISAFWLVVYGLWLVASWLRYGIGGPLGLIGKLLYWFTPIGWFHLAGIFIRLAGNFIVRFPLYWMEIFASGGWIGSILGSLIFAISFIYLMVSFMANITFIADTIIFILYILNPFTSIFTDAYEDIVEATEPSISVITFLPTVIYYIFNDQDEFQNILSYLPLFLFEILRYALLFFPAVCILNRWVDLPKKLVNNAFKRVAPFYAPLTKLFLEGWELRISLYVLAITINAVFIIFYNLSFEFLAWPTRFIRFAIANAAYLLIFDLAIIYVLANVISLVDYYKNKKDHKG